MVRQLFTTIFKGKDWIENLPVATLITSRYHWYNMVSPSPWPILISITSFPGAVGLVGTMHGIVNGLELFILSFLTFLFFFCMWNRDIVRESTFMGLHTKQVDKNTITGFKLFLFTETMLFVTFFWAHLYSALYPSVFIGLSWPPVGLAYLLLDPFDIPLTNTIILVYSGFTVTVSHLYLRRGRIVLSGWAMFISILLGVAFLYIQKEEFFNSEFNISDGIYGSTFFILTGFHGGHVIIGVTGLLITLIRLLELHFSSYSHTGFKLALIYWHFVDVVWIFVFIIVYVIGSDLTSPNLLFFINGDTSRDNASFLLVNLDVASYGKCKKYLDLFSDSYFKEKPIFQYNKWYSRLGGYMVPGNNWNFKSELNRFVLEINELTISKILRCYKPCMSNGAYTEEFYNKIKFKVKDSHTYVKFSSGSNLQAPKDRPRLRKFITSRGTLVTTTTDFTKNMSSFLIDDRSTLAGQNKEKPEKNSELWNYFVWLNFYVKHMDVPSWQIREFYSKSSILDTNALRENIVKNFKK